MYFYAIILLLSLAGHAINSSESDCVTQTQDTGLIEHWITSKSNSTWSLYQDIKLRLFCIQTLKGHNVGSIYCSQKGQDGIDRRVDDSRYYDLAARFEEQQYMRGSSIQKPQVHGKLIHIDDATYYQIDAPNVVEYYREKQKSEKNSSTPCAKEESKPKDAIIRYKQTPGGHLIIETVKRDPLDLSVLLNDISSTPQE